MINFQKISLLNRLSRNKEYYSGNAFKILTEDLISDLTVNSEKETYKTIASNGNEICNKNKEDAGLVNSLVFDKKINLNEDIFKKILKSLNEFEKTKGFINPKLKLSFLAAKLNTNNKYLSIVINTYKNKTFVSYINDLRIDYCLHCMEQDSKYCSYKISYISSQMGFGSSRSFSRAFLKRTGKQPSEYMNGLGS